jgi:hypothetical protein
VRAPAALVAERERFNSAGGTRCFRRCRTQDSNLQPPRSERGASAKLGYCGLKERGGN